MAEYEDALDQARRWLDLINYLHLNPGVRGRDLASRYNRTLRTIQRDIVELRNLGIPVDSSNGYRLSTEAFLPPLNLTAVETLAVLVGIRFAQKFGGTTLGSAAGSALLKIGRKAGVEGRRVVKQLECQVAFEGRNDAHSGAELLPTLSTAIVDRARVRIHYHSLSSPPGWRTVHPHSIYFHDASWYLQAHDERHDEVRIFRLSRIATAEVLPDRFAKSARDAAGPRHRWDFMGTEAVEVRIKIGSELARWLNENPPHPSQTLEGTEATYAVRNPLKMVLWILSLEGAEVLSPDWVRTAVADRARALMVAHGASGRIPKGTPPSQRKST